MSAQPAPLPDAEDEHIRAVLRELIDIGMEIARDLARRVKTTDIPAKDATAEYDRIARAIRRTALLLRHLKRPLAPAAPVIDRVAARKRVIRDVEDTIARKTGGSDAESLRAELADRLDTLDFETEITTRPLPDIIADICRDLGLAGADRFKRRTPAEIRHLHARAATPPGTPAPRQQTEPPPEPPDRKTPDPPPPPRTDAEAWPSRPETTESLLEYLTRSRRT